MTLIACCTFTKAQELEHVAHLDDRVLFNTFYTSYGDMLYLHIINDAAHGTFLVTDGTNAGTQIVKDIAPNASWNIGFCRPVVYQDMIYFTANGGGTGLELWASDGTSSGTELLHEIRGGSAAAFDNFNSSLAVFNGNLYFRAVGNDGDEELWVSDGTPGGTQLFKNLYTNGSGSPKFLTVVDDKMFFHAKNSFGRELWVTDGTSDGTYMVKNIHVGGNSLADTNFERIAYNDKLYFQAYNEAFGTELWASDGTESGTYLLKNINPTANSSPQNFIVYNELIFFGANDGVHGNELWVSDGTTSGTRMVKDIGADTDIQYFKTYNGKLYFGANGNLWCTDGTEEGTQFIKDAGIEPYTEMITYAGKLLFIGRGDVHQKIWLSDGTPDGTVPASPDLQLSNFFPLYNISPAKYDGAVYLVTSSENDGADLWRYQVMFTNTEAAVNDTNAFTVFPNPAYHSIRIDNTSPVTIQISNALGQVHVQQEIQANTPIEIQHLPTGRYFITDKSNRQSAVFIKQ